MKRKYRAVYRGVTTCTPRGEPRRLYAIQEWGGTFWHIIKGEGKAPLLTSHDAARRYIETLPE